MDPQTVAAADRCLGSLLFVGRELTAGELASLRLEGREPMPDEQAGIDWFNGLSVVARGFWMNQANTAVPALAWAEYKRQRNQSGQPR